MYYEQIIVSCDNTAFGCLALASAEHRLVTFEYFEIRRLITLEILGSML